MLSWDEFDKEDPTEAKAAPAVAQAGIGEPGGSLQTANSPATSSSVSECAADSWLDPACSGSVANTTGLVGRSLTVSRNTSGRA